MKIVALTLSYVHERRVGAELAMHALLRHLKARGHLVDVLTTTPVKRDHVDGVRVCGLSQYRRPDADVVLTNAGLGAKAATLWRRSPVVVWAHNAQLGTLLDVKASVKAGARVLSNTWHMRDVFTAVLGVDSRVLHPPVTGGPVVSGDAITLVNLNADKGADVFWDLAAARPDLQFLAVKGGYGHQLIRELPNVTVLEHGQDMQRVWERTRVLLVPSRHESYSMVGVEAAMRGIPAVVADLPGPREALGAGARFVSDGDWAGALDEVLGGWEVFSCNARVHAASLDPVGELDAVAAWIESL